MATPEASLTRGFSHLGNTGKIYLSAGDIICTLNGRNYYAATSGYRYILLTDYIYIDGSWVGPTIISEDPELVIYRADSGGPWNNSGTINFNGKTYYISATEHWMPAGTADTYIRDLSVYRLDASASTSSLYNQFYSATEFMKVAVGGGAIMNKVYDNFTMGNDSEFCNALASTSSKIGQNCAEFSGGQYITLPRSAMIETAMTVNFWAYMSNWSNFGTEESSGMRLVSGWESGGWGINAVNGFIHCGAYNKNVGYIDVPHSKTWASLASGWHMFTIVFDGQNLSLYVDKDWLGTSAAFSSKRIGYNANNRIFIGAEAGGSTTPVGNYFTGKVDDFKIYASALSSQDIEKEYHNRANISDKGQLFISWINEVGPNKFTSNTGGTVIGTTSSPEVFLYPKPNLQLIGSHIYYVSIYASPTLADDYGIDFFWPETAAGHRGKLNLWIGTAGETLYSWRFQGNSGGNSDGVYNARFDWNNNYLAGSVTFRDAKFIDLTELYGAGNEPTKEECDRIFNNSEQLVNEKGICEPTNNICEMGRAMRYLKVSMNGSNENSANHIKRLSYVTVDNKQVEILDATDSVDVKVGSIVQGTIGHSNYTPGGDDGPHSYSYYNVSSPMVFDLGSINVIAYINLTRYSDDGRHYYGTKLEGSLDNVNWFTIWDSCNTGAYGSDNTYNTYVETAAGKNFIVDCEEAQVTNTGTIIANQFVED